MTIATRVSFEVVGYNIGMQSPNLVCVMINIEEMEEPVVMVLELGLKFWAVIKACKLLDNLSSPTSAGVGMTMVKEEDLSNSL